MRKNNGSIEHPKRVDICESCGKRTTFVLMKGKWLCNICWMKERHGDKSIIRELTIS